MTSVILLAWTGGNVQATPLSFDALNARLVDQQASWEARPALGDRPMRAGSAAPEDDVSLTEQLHAAAGLAAQGHFGAQSALPAAFDWRDQNGTSYLGNIGAQGECGSCVSFAAVSTLEAQLNIECGTPQRSFELSRQYFFSCGGGSCARGWKVSAAVNFMVDHGVPDNSCLPYAATEGNDVGCANACENASSRLITGVSVTRPTTGYIDIDAIKRGLLKGPLLTNMILFEDLEYYGGGVYRHTAGRQVGSHAIVIVGWNDAEQAWIMRNSWGEDWGDRGYFRVAWNDVTLPGRYTWSFDVSTAKNAGVCSFPR